uniref:Uncharacterized protein n=1 Tax=Arion vulgaris TaxID=1028688 RepID=A0A0B6Z0W9_9EUPU
MHKAADSVSTGSYLNLQFTLKETAVTLKQNSRHKHYFIKESLLFSEFAFRNTTTEGTKRAF